MSANSSNLKRISSRPLKRNNYATARARMLEEQLIPRGVTDSQVLTAMGNVPRHLFVEDALQSQAYGDYALPIGSGQTISQPYIVGLMTEALNLRPEHVVLEIGTGSGYQTAVLSQLCAKVYTVERLKPLFVKARRLFDQLHYLNVVCKLDDGTIGWPAYAPFNAIIVTAAGPVLPSALLTQLADPGTMVIPVGNRQSQKLMVVRKRDGVVTEEDIEDVRFVRLIGQQGWQP
ncbi:Protein-L-isoaspartate O-methyltransferase [hydrothermal vent metagenome]|uniref:protein-L-isoaspartate(D-aspartate) O-methyltransferase n=1 Tax=hydrothermal vent metagenome TaxID=652676 RepID=A0A3B0V421_9ZZZZ